jgi:drug/metabolite transporter (DMT)-like permease
MSIPNSPEFEPEKSTLNFSRWYPFAAGLVAGLILRFLFVGKPGSSWSAMAGAFIYMAPMLVGAVTVYVAERQ